MKRMLCIFVLLCVLLSALPFSASAAFRCTEDEAEEYTVRVGDVTLPLEDYPIGVHATTDGRSCANGHYHDQRVYTTPSGRRVDTFGTQCLGFARYVFYRCFGVVDSLYAGGTGYYNAVEDIPPRRITEELLQSIFGNIALPGCHIRVGAIENGHSLIYLRSDDTYFYTYECNFDNCCTVGINRRTWSELVSYIQRKGGIAYIHMPNSYPGAETLGCSQGNHFWTVTDKTLPTGLNDGEIVYTCERCGETYSELLPCTGVCQMGASCPGHNFLDMPEASNWAHNNIEYALEQQIFSGVSEESFEPANTMTRAMLVSSLWRLAQQPQAETDVSFFDVPNDAWYTDAVRWAAENGIVSGSGDGYFAPDATVTREQIAVILCNFTRWAELAVTDQADLSIYPDQQQISFWAVEALSWANALRLISGQENEGVVCLRPGFGATRAEVASILARYLQTEFRSTDSDGLITLRDSGRLQAQSVLRVRYPDAPLSDDKQDPTGLSTQDLRRAYAQSQAEEEPDGPQD